MNNICEVMTGKAFAFITLYYVQRMTSQIICKKGKVHSGQTDRKYI